jgi:hypothetical protein
MQLPVEIRYFQQSLLLVVDWAQTHITVPEALVALVAAGQIMTLAA